jgi:hypothetical protein
MAKVDWQMVREVLERYKGQTKTETAIEIVKLFDASNPQRLSTGNEGKSRGVEH